MSDFSHLDAKGQAQMVDVTDKPVTQRTAIASGKVIMNASTLQALTEGGNKKGDVIAVARVAGIQAAKKTSDLIPLCHPLALTKVAVEITPDQSLPGLLVQATCKLAGRTGVEMEALTAVSVACLTIYDMCKAVDKTMQITDICVVEKLGGRSGHYKLEVPGD